MKEEHNGPESALVVTTRAVARKEQEQETEQTVQLKEAQCGVRPTAVASIGTQLTGSSDDSVRTELNEEDEAMDELQSNDDDVLPQADEEQEWMDDEIFSTACEKKKLTRSEKRKNRLNYHSLQDPSMELPPHVLDMSTEEFKKPQQL